jgi:GDPmannose 4,6-dehydratase
MKTAFITGFTGMVGSHLADYLINNTDWNIVGLARWNENYENVEHLFDSINKKNRIKLVYGDINDFSSIYQIVQNEKPDYVFHLAAQSYPLTSFTSPLDTLQTNIIGTAILLEAIKKCNINPVIHVCASSEVFGRVGAEHLPIKETAPFHPASPYAISKVGTDLIGRYYGEAYGMKIMTTRMFTHTGPRRGDVFAESSFAKQIALIENGLKEPVIKVGNLDSMRTWSDVRDAVRAYYMLVTINPTSGEFYNIGGTYSCTVREMLNYLLSISTVKEIRIEIDSERLRPIDADLQIPDTSKFTSHTSWKPEITFEQTMNDLLNYWRDKVNKRGTFLER